MEAESKKIPNYKEEAEALAEALYQILELSIGTDVDGSDVINRGWNVWANYYNLTKLRQIGLTRGG